MMKFVLLACLLGFAAADFQRAAAPAVHQTLLAFSNGLHKAGSLRMAVGLPHAVELDKVEDDGKDELINNLKEMLNNLIAEIKARIDKGQIVSLQLIEKLKEVSDKLSNLGVGVSEILKKYIDGLKDKAKELWKRLIEELGLGKRSVARSTFKDLIAELKERILNNENIQKIREYIKNFITNDPILHELRETLLKLKDVDLKQLIKTILDHVIHPFNKRGITDLWEKIKDLFRDLNIHISEHYIKLAEWIVEMWNHGIKQLKEKHGIIKAIAMEFIEHAKDVSDEIKREVLEFMRPYKEELGGLWDEIVAIVKSIKE